ncbi:Ig-like domain-containing protein, partial [Vibrio sinaloensis]|uniref:Ig-like domain-containing protein n=1 Tax=Photobacterium sp. (strain ATCC 43367) TaxID=379097 RepID=UPI0035E963C6
MGFGAYVALGNLVTGQIVVVDTNGNVRVLLEGELPKPGEVVINSERIAVDGETEVVVEIIDESGLPQDISNEIEDIFAALEDGQDPTQLGEDFATAAGGQAGSSLTSSGSIDRDGTEILAATEFVTQGFASLGLSETQSLTLLDQFQTLQQSPVFIDVNSNPRGDDLQITTPEDTPVSGQLVATDSDGDELTYTVSEQPDNGSVDLNEDGSWTYTPDQDYNGGDSFTVVVSDGQGGTDTITVNIGVTPVNDIPVIGDENGAPVGDDMSVTTEEDTPVSGKLTATDADNDTLTFEKGTDPSNGSVTVDADGNWTYTPNPDYNGNDSFTVVVSDGNGGTDTVTVNVGVTPVNDIPVIGDENGAPVGDDMSVTTEEDTPVSGKLTATDADNDTLTFEKGTDPSNGSVTVDADGNWTYTPNPDYNGNDSFTVVVSDGNGGTDTVTVNVGVTPVNDIPVIGDENGAPVGDDMSVTTEEDTPVSGKLTATDADNDTLTFEKGTDPSNGSVTVDADGNWTYTPNPDYNGNDSFTVVVSDGNGGSDTVTVNVGVTPVWDGTPIVEIIEDSNNDGTISNTEISGQVDVLVTVPADAEVGDTLKVSGQADVVLTQADIDNGVTYQYDRPADGDSITVTATIVDQAGNESAPGSDSAVMGDTTATPAPTVVITEDADNDGTISNTEISGQVDVLVTVPAQAEVGDTLKVSGQADVVLTQADIDN